VILPSIAIIRLLHPVAYSSAKSELGKKRMEEVEPSKGEATERKFRYDLINKSELEALAVSAIREHRQLIEADQAVYDAWSCASDDSSVSGAVLQTLQDEYIARQKRSEEQQEKLSEIIDALGYIPDVPLDRDL
jgi:hypothetical protein